MTGQMDDLPAATVGAWNDNLEGWEQNYGQPRQLPESDDIGQKTLSCKNQSEIKIFSENKELRKLTANRQ